MGKSFAVFFAISAIAALTTFHVATSYASNDGKYPCSNPQAPCVPNIVKIETDYDLANLFFENCGRLCEDMIVSYGKDISSPTSDVRFTPVLQPKTGLLSYTVGPLDPNSKYYFKLKCAESQSCTRYGQVYEVRTSHCLLSYSGGTAQAVVGRCSGGGYLAQNNMKTEAIAVTSTTPFSKINIFIMSTLVASIMTSLFIARRKYLVNYNHRKSGSRSLYRRRAVRT